MKIAVIIPFPVFPTHGGNRVRFKSMTSELEADGHDVHVILLTSRGMGDYDHEAHVRRFGDRFIKLERSPVGQAMYLARRLARTVSRRVRGISPEKLESVDELYYGGFDTALKKIADRENYDAVIVHYITMSRAFRCFAPSTRMILDTHDSFESILPDSEQRRGLLRSDIVYATQQQEADFFSRVMDVTPNRVRIQAHAMNDIRQIDLSRDDGGAFIGSSFEANRVSLQHFIDHVLPRVVRRRPDFRLFVAGSICRDIEDHPSVVKLGRVDHIEDAYRQGPILINPITVGTGLKIKLLEAMALGVPAVSTALGVRGLDPIHLGGVRITPDGDLDAFADAVAELSSEVGLRQELGRRARESAELWNAAQREALRSSLTEPLAPLRSAR